MVTTGHHPADCAIAIGVGFILSSGDQGSDDDQAPAADTPTDPTADSADETAPAVADATETSDQPTETATSGSDDTATPTADDAADDATQTAPPITATPPPAPPASDEVSPPPADTGFVEDFSSNERNWSVGALETGETTTIEDGVFKVRWSGTGASYEVYSGQTYTDFAAELDCALIEGGDNVSCGIVFAEETGVGLYEFEVLNTLYRLNRQEGGNTPITLVSGDPGGMMQVGQTNQLRVVRRNNEIQLYLNDQLLTTMTDTMFVTGRVGISTNSYSETGAEIWLDNLRIEVLP
ncbi:MAG: DUF1080 domain-containing protein [Chloroflexaceae bacterium]|nr:DUF1080 domain-containing protein [Chloroflexaceae bacterium]